MEERLTYSGTKEAKPNVTIKEVTDKLAHYENLEELASFLSGDKMSIEDILDCLKKTIKGEEKELNFSRILTNAEAKKWDKWKSLETKCLESAGLDFENMVGEFMHYYGLQKQGKLIELPCAVEDIVYAADAEPIIPLMVSKIGVYLDGGYGGDWESLSSFGKTIFLTPEAAEAALKSAEQEA